MSDLYLQPMTGAVWAISRVVAGKRIYLVQNRSMDCIEDIGLICQALGIPHTEDMLEQYFPVRGEHGRCPTLQLLELFSAINRLERTNMEKVSV